MIGRLGPCLAAAVALAACGGGSSPISPNSTVTAHPLSVTVTAESGRAVSASVGAAGGELSAVSAAGATLTLDVPAGALLSPHNLTLTPIQQVVGLPLRGGLLAGAQLGPDGLMLAKPATLTIKLASARQSGLRTYGFGYEASGTEFHLAPLHDASNLVTLQVWHFSGAGAGAGTPADASAQATNHAPSSPVDQAEQAVAAQQNAVQTLVVLYATVTSQLGAEPPNLALLDTLFWQALALEPLAVAAGRPDLVQALYVQIATVLGTAAEIAAANCVAKHDPSEGARILRWAAWATGHPQILATLPIQHLYDLGAACLKFELDYTTTIEAAFPPEHVHEKVESHVTIKAVPGPSPRFTSSPGALKYDEFVWTSPSPFAYSMKPTLQRPFSVLDFSIDLDLDAALLTGLSSDSIHMTVDYGSAIEVVTIRAPFPIPPLPLNSYYDGIETLNSDHATGRHSFRIEHWKLVGPSPWAETTYVCPCPQPPSTLLKLDQTTVFKLLHQPSK